VEQRADLAVIDGRDEVPKKAQRPSAMAYPRAMPR
jgi:hypothetical protein